MEDGDLIILEGDGIEKFFLGLLAVEVVAGSRIDQ